MAVLRSSVKRALAFAVLIGSAAAQGETPRVPLGVMGTIPIYWGENAGIAEVLAGQARPHWAKARLESEYDLRPVDVLEPASLADINFLILAQPRVLSPSENVALDDWVRAGGHLLLFADPMLTGESRFSIGDRRRPQDVALLSPILSHWGLALEFPMDQPQEERLVQSGGPVLPVRLAGRFVPDGTDADREGSGACALSAESLIADCRIGDGAGILVADAALLDLQDENPQNHVAFDWLLARAFGENGNLAGNPATESGNHTHVENSESYGTDAKTGPPD